MPLFFAAGIDERIDIAPPAYKTFNKYNVDPLRRMFSFAKKHGLKHSVVLGSYFTYFDHSRPKLELSKHHPYIASRALQKQMALAEASQDFSVAVLELPYIFGTQPGRKPVWVFLVKMLKEDERCDIFFLGWNRDCDGQTSRSSNCWGALEKNNWWKSLSAGLLQFNVAPII